MKALDISQKQEVSYCVPGWLRDEQIRLNCQRPGIGRLEAHEERSEPIAVVGFGPSLADTIDQIRAFKHVITCSGSHRYVVERGIVPTLHVEVDPRAHKVALIGPPCAETQYLIASTCHPSVFDHLKGHQVLLWHVFDATDDGRRLIPMGEWAITGGCDAGLRAMTLAAFLGFRDLHIFGMDGSARGEARHAAEHPNTPKKYNTVEYDGVTYLTTPAMLEAARQVSHELNQMPTVKATFYGDGLIQHMMRGYQPKPKKKIDGSLVGTIAYAKPPLISEEYRALNAQLHRDNLAYGVGGGKYAPTVLKLVDSLKTTSVLDYGAGKGYLAKALPFPIWEYDPAIPEKSTTPRPADVVVCTDVLEHIEPEKLPFVLDDLKRCVKKVGFFSIHTGAAVKVLADGRNAHLIQKGEHWWRKQLEKFFQVGLIRRVGVELLVVVGPKKPAQKKQIRKASVLVSAQHAMVG